MTGEVKTFVEMNYLLKHLIWNSQCGKIHQKTDYSSQTHKVALEQD